MPSGDAQKSEVHATIDDASTAPVGNHVGHERARQLHRSDQVDLDLPLDVLVGLIDHRQADFDASVVDQQVDFALRIRSCREPGAVGCKAHIAGDDGCLRAGGLYQCSRCCESGFIACCQDHRAAIPRQVGGNHTSDAARRTGNHDHPLAS